MDTERSLLPAVRPELFCKATPGRVRGPGAAIGIRRDSGWDVPEPELALVADASGRLVAVTVGNGKVVNIDGSTLNAPTGGYICAKVRKFGDRVYGDARLRYPAVRTGPKGSARFSRISTIEGQSSFRQSFQGRPRKPFTVSRGISPQIEQLSSSRQRS